MNVTESMKVPKGSVVLRDLKTMNFFPGELSLSNFQI